jgi:hypothetical protein
MDESNSTLPRNQRLAREINQEARDNPHSQYAGKFVGIASGKVVVIADDLDEVARQLRRADPDPANTLCFEPGVDYDVVQEIWEA